MEREMEPPRDLRRELYREYDYGGRVYWIDHPQWLFVGMTTHRVVDVAGVVHCVPAPGEKGCALRWMPRLDGMTGQRPRRGPKRISR